jgi:hypothetical protein
LVALRNFAIFTNSVTMASVKLSDVSTSDDEEAQVVVVRGKNKSRTALAASAPETKAGPLVVPSLGSKLSNMGKGLKGARGLRFEVDLLLGKFVTTGATGTYGYVLNPGSGVPMYLSNIGNTTEWASVAALFDEYFLKSVECVFVPINQFNGLIINGGDASKLSTTIAVICANQHASTAISDSATAMLSAAIQSQHRVVNTARPFKFFWHNAEKFSWTGPVTDQSTANSSQGWLNVANYAKQGGFLQMFGPSITGTASATVLAASSNVGFIIYRFKTAFRVRA